MKIRVYYEDTDAGGIVYHTNYIKYCERARSELFFAQDMSPVLGENSGFVVRKIEADFLGSATLGDLLEVRSGLIELKRSSATLRQEVFREDEKLFGMQILLVYMSEGRITRIPEDFRSLFDLL